MTLPRQAAQAGPSYDYRHVVSFEETNMVGNVYYVNHLRWQGRCREEFLRENFPEVLGELANGLAIATTRCSCRYYTELEAFDEVLIRMRLVEVVQNRLTMRFEYFRLSGRDEEQVAEGDQEVAFLRREDGELTPVPVPPALRAALRPYRAAGRRRS